MPVARYRLKVAADIDLDAAAEFCDLLGAPQLTFQSFDDREQKDPRLARILHGALAEHEDELCELNRRGAGVFIAINPTDGRGRKAENITGIRAVLLDLDRAPLDPVRTCKLKPNIVVETSPGRYQVYWLVESFPIDQFEGVQRALAKRFDGDPAVALLTQCARVPGFLHNKGEPFETRIIDTHDAPPYSADQILAEFPPEATPHAESGSRVILPAGAPLHAAEEYIKRHRSWADVPLLRAYRGAFYLYTGTHYREYPDENIERDVYAFLNEVLVQDKNGNLGPYNPTRSKVGEVVHGLRRGLLIDRGREHPFG